ncbi:tetratricopeptide repeat protein [Roseibium sp.]|uniref:tetratricopeptide repeat protein n=1 Tax=Roseibium sp. TaxID=1936156 RepID=UPI003A96D168
MAEQTTVQLEEHELISTVRRNFEWGNADVFALGRRNSISRLGEIAGYLSMMGDKDGNPYVDSVCVVLPPFGGRSKHQMHGEVREGLGRAFRRFETDEQRTFQFVEKTIANLLLVQATDFDQETLAKLLPPDIKNQAIIIGEAALYTSSNVKPFEEGSYISEDIWCAHLHHLMTVVEIRANSTNNYIILDTGEELPLRSSNIELLKSVGNVGLCGNVREEDLPPEDVISRVSAVHGFIEAGAVGKALSLIENDDSLSDMRKWYLRLVVYQQAGFQDEASQILDESDEKISSLNSHNLIGVAKVAAEIGRDDFAQVLIERALPDLLGLTELEVALLVALKTHRQWLIETVRQRIKTLHPSSELLRSIDGRSAARSGDYDRASAQLRASLNAKEQELGELYRLLADGISGPCFSQPTELMRSLAAKKPEWASEIQREIMRSLERTGRRDEAVALLFSGEIAWDNDWFNVARGILERSLVSGSQAVGTNVVLRFIDLAATHIAAHPDDGCTRTTMADFFEVERTGFGGITALVMNALGRAVKSRKIEKDDHDWEQLGNIERLPNIIERALVSLGEKNNGVVQMGRDAIPVDVLGEDPDQVLNGLYQMVDYYANASNSPTDEQVLKHIATVAFAIAPAAKNVDGDLEIVRLIAVQLILNGRSQDARDLAELMLAVAGKRPERRRKALTAFADIYARLHRSREALLVLIAALELPSDGTWIEIWKENTILLRVLRDIGLVDESLHIIEHLREVSNGSTSADFYATRLEMLEFHVQFLKYVIGSVEAWPITRLLESAVANAQAVLDVGDEALPISVMMRQLIDHAELDGMELSSEVHRTLQDLSASLAGSHQSLIAAMDRSPKASAIASVASSIQSARYNDDVSYDLRIARTMGSKLARSSTQEADPEGFAYSVELLSAQGVGVHHYGKEIKAAARIFEDTKSPLHAAVEIAGLGIPIIGLASDGNGLMSMTVTAEGPQAPVAVPSEIFDPRQLIEWGQTFPYAYSDPRLNAEGFRDATKHLGLPWLPERTLIISGDLSRVPPNVLTVEDDLAGASRALASTPSLSWLKASIAENRQSDGTAAAWIPVAAGASHIDTLNLMAGDIEEILTSANIELYTHSSTPTALASADLAIIGAHGGLAEDNRYFRGLGDDRHEPTDLRQLTDILRGSRVAVLFVCSGGRLDLHPESGGLLGITHKLLDNGLSAVIAPSWPIPFTLARPWLNAFLNSWSNGDWIIDACFAGNNAVADATSHDFGRSLAMTLYGNPFITR